MKRNVKMLYIVVILSLSLSACYGEKEMYEIENTAEIMAIFKENEDLFCGASDVLIPFTEKHYYISKSEKNTLYNNGQNLYQVKDIYIYTPRNQVLNYMETQSIYGAVAPLFELHNMEYICCNSTGVIQFGLETWWGRYADLFFNPSGVERLTGFGVVDELQINEFWYAIISSD